MVDNIFPLKGVIYSKEEKSGASKKAGEPDWRMCIVKIESVALIRGKSITSICEFIFDWNVSFDEFSTGDQVECDFYFVNRKIKRKDGGIWDKEEKRILFMKFSDITTPEKPRKDKDGKTHVNSMTNPDELTNPKKDTIFTGAKPSRPSQVEEEIDDDLPF